MRNSNKIAYTTLLIFVIAIMSCFLLSSCSCGYHLNQVRKNCPEVFKRDTLTIRDTIYVNREIIDTIFSDTVKYIVKENERVRGVYNHIHDKVYLSAECKSDTIYTIKTIHVPSTIDCGQYYANLAKYYIVSYWRWLVVLLLVFSAIMMAKKMFI